MEEPGAGEAGRLRTGTRKENISVLQYISSALYWQSLTWYLLAKEKYLKSLHLSRAGGQIWSWEVFDKLINGTVGSSDDTCLSFCLKISPSLMGIFAMCIIYIFFTTWSYHSIVFWFSLSHLSFLLFFICLFFFPGYFRGSLLACGVLQIHGNMSRSGFCFNYSALFNCWIWRLTSS